MSKTSIYAAFEDGDMKLVNSFKNSLHSGYFIWNYIAKTYCGFPNGVPSNNDDDMGKIWAAADDLTIPENIRLALLTTFDYHLVGPEHMIQVACALETFPGATENILYQAQAIRKLFSQGAKAVGWQQTSVAESFWVVDNVNDENPEDDEGNDRPYNINKDSEHSWIEI